MEHDDVSSQTKQESGYGEFPDGQLRTPQRRVRLWRMRFVRQLVFGTDETAPHNNGSADLKNSDGVTAG
jgi:hypothetical protein